MKFIGIDVAMRQQTIAIMDESLKIISLLNEPSEKLAEKIMGDLEDEIIIAIDAPRHPSANPDGKRGRACERELHRMGYRVQWTPNTDFFQSAETDQEWMRVGFDLFYQFENVKKLGRKVETIEIFPSASYGLFPSKLVISIPFNLFNRKTKKDQIDAICGSLTAYCYHYGFFSAVGDSQEGQIIIPNFKKKL